jgi:hypothetical protein
MPGVLPRMSSFVYHLPMKLEINPRGNGACPLCAAKRECRLHKKLIAALAPSPDPDGEGMEIVVYSCPEFKERA